MPEYECNVIAFDPGETTGWCVMGVEKVCLSALHGHGLQQCVSEHIFKTGQIDCRDENDGVTQMLNIWTHWPKAVVVHEDFIVDMNKIDQARHTLSPVRITAKFEYGAFLQGFDYERIFIQNRSLVKTTFTDDRLKNLNLYDRNSGPHARDAVRHAFYFLRDCRGSSLAAEEKRWKAWPHLFSDPLPEHTKSGAFRMRKRPEETAAELTLRAAGWPKKRPEGERIPELG